MLCRRVVDTRPANDIDEMLRTTARSLMVRLYRSFGQLDAARSVAEFLHTLRFKGDCLSIDPLAADAAEKLSPAAFLLACMEREKYKVMEAIPAFEALREQVWAMVE